MTGIAATASGLVARRRPTLPHLEMQYHGRWSVSRPSSGWDRVYHLRDDHRATGPDALLLGFGWVVFEWLGARLGAVCGIGVCGR